MQFRIAMLTVALMLCLSATAQAHPRTFKISDDINFITGEATFTASSSLCPAGSFADDVLKATDHPNSTDLVISTVFTCDDGSGTFTAIKYLHLRFTDTGFTDTGVIHITGGTGTHAGIRGLGVTKGATENDIGSGVTQGVLR